MMVIGIAGPFGSGCSYVSDIIHEKKGYFHLSLSTVLKNIFQKNHPDKEYSRSELQNYGNYVRKEYGRDYLAKEICKEIEGQDKNYIIDSIRNPSEVEYLKRNLQISFLSVFLQIKK